MTDSKCDPILAKRTRAVTKRKPCGCDCEKMEGNPSCLMPSNRQNETEDPSQIDAGSVSTALLNANETPWPPDPAVKQENLDDEIKENHNIYEQLVQICTEMSVKRYVESSEAETIKFEIKNEEDLKEQDMIEPEITIKIEDDGIDTTDLAQKIQHELRRFEISQTIFARKILNRSQGTLSDLLKRPQPWAALGSGRHTYQRMADWLQLPDEQKLLLKVTDDSDRDRESPKTVRRHKTMFTDLQKNTLRAVFKETSRPSKVMMLLIAKQLELDSTSVQNYFMNARRRQAKFEASGNSSSSSSEVTAKVKRLKRPKVPRKPKPIVPHVTGD